MSITLTLFAQMLTFFIFVVLMMKLVWPKISNILEARRKRIADGLAAAEQGRRELERAQYKIKEFLQDSKLQAADIIEKANLRAQHIETDAKQKGLDLVTKMQQTANDNIKRATLKAKTELKDQVADLVVASTAKLIQANADQINTKSLVDNWAKEL